MADSWQVVGTPPLASFVKPPPDAASRFHVALPGRSGDENGIAQPWKNRRYSQQPGLLSLKKKLPPVQLVPTVRELPPLPEASPAPEAPPAQPSSVPTTAAQALEARSLPSLVQGELPKFAVPAPPPRPRSGAIRPSRQHERLPGGSARGIRSRAIAHSAFKDMRSDVAPSRWGDMKVLYTELVEAINSVSIPTLLHIIAQAQVRGAQGWPEYGVAVKKLSVLQSLHAELQEAASATDIGAIERALADASVLKVGPDVAGDKLWAVRGQAESRLIILRRVEAELHSATRGTSIPGLAGVLRSVQEVGVGHWSLATQAECRLRFLQSLSSRLYDAANGSSYDAVRDAVSSAELLGVTDDTDFPLGLALITARKRMIALEGVAERSRDLSALDDIEVQLSAAADAADVGALRAAVVDADIAFTDGRVKVADKANWQSFARARDRLATLSALEVEFLALQSTTLTDNLVAAIARADTLGCNSWDLCREAEDRLDKVRMIESEMFQAVSENSLELLEKAVMNASSAGLSAWPHARAARKLLQRLGSAGEAEQGQVMQQFLSDLSNRVIRCNLPVEQQNLLHAGLLVRIDEGSSQRDQPSFRAGIELAMRSALHVDVDVVRVFHMEPSALVVELLMCPHGDPSAAVKDLQMQLDMDESTSMLKNCIFGESVSQRPQLLHMQVVDKFAARAWKRHAGTGLGSVASTDSRCSTVSGPPSEGSFHCEELSYECSRQLFDSVCSESALGNFRSVDKDEWSVSGSCASRSYTPSGADIFASCMEGACMAEEDAQLFESRTVEERSIEGAFTAADAGPCKHEIVAERSMGEADPRPVTTGSLDSSMSGLSAPVVCDMDTESDRSRPYTPGQLASHAVQELLTGAVDVHSSLPDYLKNDPQSRQYLEAVCVTSELLASALNYLARNESPGADTTRALSSIARNLQDIPYCDVVAQTPGAWASSSTINSVARDAMFEAFELVRRDNSRLSSRLAFTEASMTLSPGPSQDRVAEEAAQSLVQRLFVASSDDAEAVARVQFAFENLDFDKVMSSPELADSLKSKVRGGIASSLEVPEDCVDAALSKGSVLVNARVRAVPGKDAAAMMKQIDSTGDALLQTVSERVTQIPAINAAKVDPDATLGVSGLRTTLEQVKSMSSAQDRAVQDVALSNSVISFVSFKSLEDMAFAAVNDAVVAFYHEQPDDDDCMLDVESVATSTARERIAADATAHMVRSLFSHSATRLAECQLSEDALSHVVGGNEARNLVWDAVEENVGPAKSVSLIDVDERTSCADAEVALVAVQGVVEGVCYKPPSGTPSSIMAVSMVAATDDNSAMSSFLGHEIANVSVHKILTTYSPAQDAQPLAKAEQACPSQDAASEAAVENAHLATMLDMTPGAVERDASEVMPSGISCEEMFSPTPTAKNAANEMVMRALDATSAVTDDKMSCEELSPTPTAKNATNEMVMRALDVTSVVTEDKHILEQVQEDQESVVSLVIQEALSTSMAQQLALADGGQQQQERILKRDISASVLSGASTYGAGDLGRALVNDATAAALGQREMTEISDMCRSCGSSSADAAAVVVDAAEEAISQFVRSESPITVSGLSNDAASGSLSEFVLARAVAIYAVRAAVQRAHGIETTSEGLAEQYQSQDELMSAMWRFAEEYISHTSGSRSVPDPLLAGTVVCDVLAGAVGHLAWRRISEAALSNMIGASAARSQVHAILERRNQSASSDVASWASDAVATIQRMSPDSWAPETMLGRDVAKYALDTATLSCAQSSLSKIMSTSGSSEVTGAGASPTAKRPPSLNAEAEDLRLTALRLSKRDGPRNVERTRPGEGLPSSAFHSSVGSPTDFNN